MIRSLVGEQPGPADRMTMPLADLSSTVASTSGACPPAVIGASTTVLGDTVYVFGGRRVSSQTMTSDLWALDLHSRQWTFLQEAAASPTPPPRYFHSTCARGDRQLVLFGGMTSESTLSALNDVWVFDVRAGRWTCQAAGGEHEAPQPRYAHLGCVRGEELYIIGGQDMENKYVEEVSVFSLATSTWTFHGPFAQQCGAYRSVVTDTPEGVCIYSNYNFTDVRRELSFCLADPAAEELKVRDCSRLMPGPLPPGLRFPCGDVCANHLILSGTFLTSTAQSYSVWAMSLDKLEWQQIDGGKVFANGSWNRAVAWPAQNKLVILGDLHRRLSPDYEQRRLNFKHLLFLDLEAHGLASFSSPVPSPAAVELGKHLLNTTHGGDMEIISLDRVAFPVNSRLLSSRWGTYFLFRFTTALPPSSSLVPGAPASPTFPASARPRQLYLPHPSPIVGAILTYLYTTTLPEGLGIDVLVALLPPALSYELPLLAKLVKEALHACLNEGLHPTAIYEAGALSHERGLQVRALRVLVDQRRAEVT